MNGNRALRIWLVSAFLALCLVAGLTFLRLSPPGKLVMAAGPESGGYYQIALKYRDILARDNIQMDIVTTAGSAENADLISASKVDAAILQGGIRTANPQIETIGSIFFEPVIFLARKEADIPANPVEWTGLRINSGEAKSGTATAIADFERAVGLDPAANVHTSFNYATAVTELSKGNIDIAAFVAPINAPYLVEAYSDPSLKILLPDHTDAISRLLEYADIVTVPTGALSLRPVIPDRPVHLLALDARLAVSPDMHPALVNRLTMAAIELHSGRGVITDQGAFPTVEGTEMLVNNAARQLIVNGPSVWHDWLPYWMASQVHRLILLMLPILFILVPAIRAIPFVYAYFMRWRVWQHYPEIRSIEEGLKDIREDTDLADMDTRLISLDEKLASLRLPAAYRETAYEARVHIELVRKHLDAIRQAVAVAE